MIHQEEDLDEAARRILELRTGINNNYLEEFKVFGKANRNSKQVFDKLIELNYSDAVSKQTNSAAYQWFTKRFISYVLVDINKVKSCISEIDVSIEWVGIHRLSALIMDYNKLK